MSRIILTILVCVFALLLAGCREIIVNSVAWATCLTLEETKVARPAPGQRPARDYFFGYRINTVRIRGDGVNITDHERELYEFADENSIVYGIEDDDGGKSKVFVSKDSKSVLKWESYSPEGNPRPVPVESRAILEQILTRF